MKTAIARRGKIINERKREENYRDRLDNKHRIVSLQRRKVLMILEKGKEGKRKITQWFHRKRPADHSNTV